MFFIRLAYPVTWIVIGEALAVSAVGDGQAVSSQLGHAADVSLAIGGRAA
jgi:hypothetical protein